MGIANSSLSAKKNTRRGRRAVVAALAAISMSTAAIGAGPNVGHAQNPGVNHNTVAAPSVTQAPKKKFTIDVDKTVLTFNDVELGKPYDGMFVPASMTKKQTVLLVDVRVPASATNAFGKMKVWVTDEKGIRSEVTTVTGTGEVAWLFAVAKKTKSFVLHFPTGQTVDLSPMLG